MVEKIVSVLADLGYPGIVLLMFAENLFPPIPSELIMPLAGFAAARGELSLVGVAVMGMVGSVLGALPWYYAGRRLGAERMKRLAGRYGRWLTITPEDVDRASGWFDRHGGKAVLLCHFVPAIRTLISIPAGIARMSLMPFLFYTMIGTLFWSAVLALSGFLLESQYRLIADYLDPAAKVVLGLMAAAYLYRLVKQPQAGRD